jgi:hypothetical protein
MGDWTRHQFYDAVQAILGDETFLRETGGGYLFNIDTLCKTVAIAVFLGEAQEAAPEQFEIVRETMRRLIRVEGVHGLK